MYLATVRDDEDDFTYHQSVHRTLAAARHAVGQWEVEYRAEQVADAAEFDEYLDIDSLDDIQNWIEIVEV